MITARKDLVVLIDFDGQANLSNILLGDQIPEKTITDVMSGKAEIRECIMPTRVRNLDIVPSSIYLFAIERRMLQETAGIQQFKLRRALKSLKEYDEIVIDNNPSLNMCSTNALCACDEVIIPTIADRYLRRYRENSACGIQFRGGADSGTACRGREAKGYEQGDQNVFGQELYPTLKERPQRQFKIIQL